MLTHSGQRAAEKEAAIQKAATKQVEGLQLQVDELQRQLQARIKEVGELSKNANASHQVGIPASSHHAAFTSAPCNALVEGKPVLADLRR